MKPVRVLIACIVLASACALAQGAPEIGANAVYFQQAVPPPSTAVPPPDVFFHLQHNGEKGGVGAGGFVAMIDDAKAVTGAPYSATAVTETTQVLADGNRIVNKSSATLARDGQGRTRREEAMGRFGPLAVSGPKIAFINDPVSKTNYILNLTRQTFQAIQSESFLAGKTMVKPGPVMHRGPLVNVEEKITTTGGAEQKVVIVNPEGEAGPAKTESLGTQMIEGVSAEGKRVTRTIPAGQIGNERPLEITSEVWTSPELQMIVLSKRNDPRFGETVYRLTDIKRAEPDPSLFEVPANFSKMDGK